MAIGFEREQIRDDQALERAGKSCVRRQGEGPSPWSGYADWGAGEDIHDTYHKPPLYSFEMHRMLFQTSVHGSTFDDAAVPYYADVKSRLIKDPDNRYGWHFSDEDCYIHILAHTFKHYDGGGTGVRTLLDIWLYRREKESLDEDYIAAELEKLGLFCFERRCCSISDRLFGWPQSVEALTEGERKIFWMEESGVYGTSGSAETAGDTAERRSL